MLAEGARFDRCIRRYRHYLEQGIGKHRALPGLKTLAEAFLLTPASLWLFTTRADVTPTNNMAVDSQDVGTP
jgi:hypothetical protein